MDASDEYLAWLSDPLVNQYLEVRFTPPETVLEIARYISDVNADSHALMFGIFLNLSGHHIGNIRLGDINWNHLTADVGFLIGDKGEWGKGYATAAIIQISEYAFKEIGIEKLTAGCYAQNEGSHRALIKSGFVEEGRRLSQCIAGTNRLDGILLGRVRARSE